MIDLHLTEDADIETVRGIVRQDDTQVQPALADRVRQTVEKGASQALDGHDIGSYTVSVDVDVVADRVPGAPRERVTVNLDFEGDDSVVAAVDDAVGAPDRANIADALEKTTKDLLRENDLDGAVEVTVSVTPIQFR